MGGSSLAAEGFLDLRVLDTTDPAAIRRMEDWARESKCLFVVSSKSGTTVEALSLMKYFFGVLSKRSGRGAGNHFVAITIPEPLSTPRPRSSTSARYSSTTRT